MTGEETHWVRITGDGLAYDGPCVLKGIIFWPDANSDYVDVYDGRDTTSGKKFCRVEAAVQLSHSLDLGDGVAFGRGIYVDGIDAAVETTLIYVPLMPNVAAS